MDPSDEDSDVQRLGRLDLTTGKFSPVGRQGKWDVDNFAISKDGRTIAFVTNEAGIARLSLMDVRGGRIRRVTALPAGVIGGLEFAPWGALGFSLSSAKSPSDVYSLDPATLRVTRWTQSETGGLDTNVNVEPQLVEVKSFDGEPISGFLYRPDPRRFPGKRPLMSTFMEGPKARPPGFLGRCITGNEQGASSSPTSAARPATASASSASTTARSSARTASRTSPPSSRA